MIFLKAIRSCHFPTLLNLQGPSNILKNHPENSYILTSLISSNSLEYSFVSSIYWRPFSISALFAKISEEKSPKFKEPLSVFFKGAVGLSERIEDNGVEAEDESENAKLNERLRNLENEVRSLNKKKCEKEKTLKLLTRKSDLIVQRGSKRSLSALFSDKKTEEVKLVKRTDLTVQTGAKRSLSALFSDKKTEDVKLVISNKKTEDVKLVTSDKKIEDVKLVKRTDFGHEDRMVYKELSSDMQTFAHHLYMEGYLKDANFLPKHKFDVTCFQISYAREVLKSAAVRFGKDHQEIAKWLSASDQKKVALFGCPSLGRKSVYAAKHMRRFFEIEEHKVCQRCTLKESCKHANVALREGTAKLYLSSVMRVLTMYALESVPKQLVVPEEIKNSVSRLLMEIIKLSQTVT